MSGDTALSPVSSFITPFLARKGDGGMVDTVVGTGVTGAGRRLAPLRPVSGGRRIA